MTSRFQGSGRLQEGGFLGTHKHDFNAHQTGADWRHGATDIDMEPIIPALGGTTVQQTLEQMSAFLAAQGSGFISIGKADGYDGYAAGIYNVGAPGIPTLSDAFVAAFADARLVNGGIVLVLAGTYELLSTVDVPPGITIMGEMAGTIIIGHAIESSMFRILAGQENTRIGGDSGSGTIRLDAGEPLDATTFWNLILADNLDGYVQSGGNPISVMQTVPMIDCQLSSNFECKQVRFIGRVNNGPVSGRAKTIAAIGGYTSGGGIGSKLTLRDCYFDGLQIGIDFIPSNGDIDFLTIEGCKARIFGTEDAGSIGRELNCFVNMSLCNLLASNNYMVSVSGSFIFSCFNTETTGGGGTDVTILITGTSGGGFTTSSLIFSNDTSSPIKAVKSGNNWNSAVGADWYITVAEGTALDETGDFIGTNAIDLVLAGATTHNYPATIIVSGEGPFEITNYGNDRFNYVGKREGDKRPIIDLNLDSGAPTDEVGNRYFTVGSLLQNINFRCRTSVTSSYHTVRPDDTTGNSELNVINCHFLNTALSPDENYDNGVTVVNSIFEQDDTYSDNIGIMVATAANEGVVRLHGCKFVGAGYAGLIGSDSGIGYTDNGQAGGLTILRNCIFDKTGFSFDDASPLTIESYLVIDNSAGRILIDGCNFLADNTGVSTTTINASLDTTFLRFIYMSAANVVISNSYVSAPQQTIEIAAVDHALPGFEIITTNDVHINNSRFEFGGTCLKILGTISDIESGGLNINNSSFYSTTANIGSNNLLHIECDNSLSLPISVNVIGSHFSLSGTNNLDITTNMTGSLDYSAIGIVQVFANNANINFSNNHVSGTIGESAASLPASQNDLAGVVLDGSDDGNTNISTSVMVNNNHIFVNSFFANAISGDSSSALNIQGVNLSVGDNYIQMEQSEATSTSNVNCIYLQNRPPSGGGGITPGIISGNMISTFELDGTAGLGTINGYIYLGDGSAGDGIIVDNTFSEATTVGKTSDGSALFDGDAGGGHWASYRNKNQTEQALVNGAVGQLVADGLSAGGLTQAQFARPINSVNSGVQILWDSGGQSFERIISMNDLLPLGVIVISIDLNHETLSVPDVTNDLVFKVEDTAGAVTSATINPGVSETTATLSSINKRNTPSSGLYFEATWTINDSAAADSAFLTDLLITYRW